METAAQNSPENPPEHIQNISETMVRYAKGLISPQEYRQKVDSWWETNKEAWREEDLGLLFRLVCLNSL